MTEPNFRDLCAELAEKIDYTWGDIPEDVEKLIIRARAALAEQPVEPTVPNLDCDEIEVPAYYRGGGGDEFHAIEVPAYYREDEFHAYRDGFANGWAKAVTKQPVGPTDEELDEFAVFWWGSDTDERTVTDVIECCSMAAFARAVLAQWRQL